MQVILLERVEKLGQMGDVVNVKAGYARNFLLPQKKALRATDENRVRFEDQRSQLEARNLERRGEAHAVGEKLDGQSYVVLRQAGETGQLYGSVTTRDIAEQVTEAGFSVTKGQIVLDRPIKEIGLHDVRVVLHPEVTVTVSLNVARTAEEAERQARGEVLTGSERRDEDEDDALGAEEAFEREDLAEAAEAELGEEQTTEADGEESDNDESRSS